MEFGDLLQADIRMSSCIGSFVQIIYAIWSGIPDTAVKGAGTAAVRIVDFAVTSRTAGLGLAEVDRTCTLMLLVARHWQSIR